MSVVRIVRNGLCQTTSAVKSPIDYQYSAIEIVDVKEFFAIIVHPETLTR